MERWSIKYFDKTMNEWHRSYYYSMSEYMTALARIENDENKMNVFTNYEKFASGSKLKTANVYFGNPLYNYATSVNGLLSDEEIIDYFKGKIFNLGSVEDDLQLCVDCTVQPSDF